MCMWSVFFGFFCKFVYVLSSIYLSGVSLFSFVCVYDMVVYERWFILLQCRRLSSGMYLLVFMWDCTACSDTFVWKVNSSPVGGERVHSPPVLKLSVCGPARPQTPQKTFTLSFVLLISTSVFTEMGFWTVSFAPRTLNGFEMRRESLS